MFLRNFFQNNSIFLFSYLILILAFFAFLFTIFYRQLKSIIGREQEFSKFQTLIQTEQNINFERYLELGTLLLNKKLYSQSIKYLKLATIKCDDIILLGNIYNNLGYCYFKQDNNKHAKSFYEEALLYLPDYIIALNKLSYLEEKEKNYTQALDLYEKSYRFYSQNPITIKQRKKIRKVLNY